LSKPRGKVTEMETRHITKFAFLAWVVMLSSAVPNAMAENDLLDAIKNGDVKLNLRYRYEIVSQDGFAEDANASTLRTRLAYDSQEFNGWKLILEGENVTEILSDNFNSGAGTSSPDRDIYPLVADPNSTEFNQVYLSYTFNEEAFIRLGRQRILLDNQRFVGGVGWRQNEQTFDGFSLKSEIGQGALFYSFIYKVNRIFGDDVAAGDHDQNTHLVNYTWPVNEMSNLTIYYYDIDNHDNATFSTRTLGAHFKGNAEFFANRTFNWRLEYALQDDNGNNPVDYKANYFRIDVGYQPTPEYYIFAGWEVLEGDDEQVDSMFRTPLATLHLFNGWADRFLTTPSTGLKDTFVGANGKVGKSNWQVIWHDFQAESTKFKFGWELDAKIAFKPSKRTELLLKAALFKGESGEPDVTKLWLMLTTNF